MEEVDNYIPQPPRLIDGPFLLAVEHVISVRGRGTVVTGKIEQGKVQIEDNLELVSKIIKSTVCLGLEMFKRSLDYGEVGDNIGVLIRGIKRDEVKRGNILAHPGIIKPFKVFEAKVYILTKKEGGRHRGFTTNYKPQFFFRTANVTGTIILLNNIEIVMPGDEIIFAVQLTEAIPLNMALRFVMREGHLTIGAGLICKLSSTDLIQ